MINWMSFALMLLVLGWNIQGILEVGIDNASNMQWAITAMMTFFVVFGLWQRLKDK